MRVDINVSDPALVVGSEFNITLLSAVDTSGYEVGLISENNTSTITIGDPMADLAIVKADSKDPVRIGESFYYTIAVSNRGTAPASNVKVVDTMPVGYLAFVDLASTNNASPGWNCTQNILTNSVVCTHNGDIADDSISIIQIHLIVPLNVSLLGAHSNHKCNSTSIKQLIL